MCIIVSSIRGSAAYVYITVANKLVYGGSRVHDGKFRHGAHVFL